jgi:hypothetical protein
MRWQGNGLTKFVDYRNLSEDHLTMSDRFKRYLGRLSLIEVSRDILSLVYLPQWNMGVLRP